MRWGLRALRECEAALGWAPSTRPTAVGRSVRLAQTAMSTRSQRRLLRRLGLDTAELGIPVPWYARVLSADRGTRWVWVLQKNSSAPKRVRAVATNATQRTSLDDLNRASSNSTHYSWSRFELQGRRWWWLGRTASEVHALVRLPHGYEQPSAAIKVRVHSVYTDRHSAVRELTEATVTFPNDVWAVITYPIGEMLF